MLEVDSATKTFGGLTALDDVSFTLSDGELIGLIGPNGAGKTTLFNVIAGVLEPDSGSVRFDSTDLTGLKPNEICHLGVTRTFQIARAFEEMTVLKNVMTGAIFGTDGAYTREDARSVAEEYVDFVGLEGQADTVTKRLNISDRKLVELARALATEPRLVLIDELCSGLTPNEIDYVTGQIEKAQIEYDISIFWVEHIMDAIMSTTSRILVLNRGALIADGTPEKVRADPAVEKAYLGGE